MDEGHRDIIVSLRIHGSIRTTELANMYAHYDFIYSICQHELKNNNRSYKVSNND